MDLPIKISGELKTTQRRDWVKVDRFSRYQNGLATKDLFPSINGFCACGCGRALPPKKRRWFSEECHYAAYVTTAILKGNTGVIRQQLEARDGGGCRMCGVVTDNWHADHIIPVHKGGGYCGLENFQTLCTDCHKEKTKIDMQ